MLEVIRCEAPNVHGNRSIVAYSNPLALLVLVRYLTVDTHDLGTLYTGSQVLLSILRADAASYGTILTQGVTHTETNHGITVLAALWKFREELADYHEAIAVVEVIAVDYAERLLDDILCHQNCMVCTPWFLTTFWYRESLWEIIQCLEAKLCRNMTLIL